MNEPTRIKAYEAAYLADYGFEAVLVRYRQRRMLETIARVRPGVVLEIGCGAELLCEQPAARVAPIKRWVIVEPAERFQAIARERALAATVVHGFIEASVDAARAALGRAPDLILCAGLLHEVPDPARVLAAIRAVCSRETVVHVSVPNAGSFHRRLAQAMGLIDSVTDLSERNRVLHQPRVFDRLSLRTCLEEAGFAVQNSGGYFMKPFTHAQMEQVAAVLPEGVMDGLQQLGEELPELAAEIFADVMLAT